MSKDISVYHQPNIQLQPMSIIPLPVAWSQCIHVSLCKIQQAIPKTSDRYVVIGSWSWTRVTVLPPSQTCDWPDQFLLQKYSCRWCIWYRDGLSILSHLSVYISQTPNWETQSPQQGSHQSLILGEAMDYSFIPPHWLIYPHWNRNPW